MKSSNLNRLLDPKECFAIAEALGDTPETVIAVHLLRRGLCRAFVAGNPSCFEGAMVQSDFLPDEPEGFGSDPEVLWNLLKVVKGWNCVNVASECARPLGEIIQRKMGVQVRYYDDIYHILKKHVSNFYSKAVRQLTPADLKLLESAPAEVQGFGFESPAVLLSKGIVACAVASDNIVAIAHTSARTKAHADLGVFTLQEWRGQGFATSASSIVAKRVQQSGQIPVWSTGERNIASLRIAEKLGFTQVSRRTYVVLDKGS